MKYALPLFAALLLITFGCSCTGKRSNQKPVAIEIVKPDVKPELMSQFAGYNSEPAFRLYNMADGEGQNLFFSPHSISTALSMAYGGARGNTSVEMKKALSFLMEDDIHHLAFANLNATLNEIGKRGKASLSVANGLFQSKTYEDLLLPEYRKLLQQSYGSDIESLDFSDHMGTAGYINKWVLDRTNNRIKDLVSPEHIKTSNDGMVLVNAIFFKGDWLRKFNPKSTYETPFYLTPDRSEEKPVKMMYAKDSFGYLETPNCQVLNLPYAEKDLAMLVILPDENSKTPPTIDETSFKNWLDKIRTQEVKVHIPRFKMDLMFPDLSTKLKEMGMVSAFSAAAADFSGIRDPRGGAGLFIKDVIHKAFVEVNEEGTEAAAATAIVMETMSMPPMEIVIPTFKADHPFTYIIYHKPTRSILFMGKLADPPDLTD
ncbi:MAG: serpin family protein [Candidatus Cloacimonetes bacterium]|nr:serpin family protein [Candidatus Cloacimonadota bacterium]